MYTVVDHRNGDVHTVAFFCNAKEQYCALKHQIHLTALDTSKCHSGLSIVK